MSMAINTAKSEFGVHHLFKGFMTLIFRKSGINDLHTIFPESFGEVHGIFTVLHHTDMQGMQVFQDT